jgi:hypothetical protein
MINSQNIFLDIEIHILTSLNLVLTLLNVILALLNVILALLNDILTSLNLILSSSCVQKSHIDII